MADYVASGDVAAAPYPDQNGDSSEGLAGGMQKLGIARRRPVPRTTLSDTNTVPESDVTTYHDAPSAPVKIRYPSKEIQQPSTARIEIGNQAQSSGKSSIRRKPVGPMAGLEDRLDSIRTVSQGSDADSVTRSVSDASLSLNLPSEPAHTRAISEPFPQPQNGQTPIPPPEPRSKTPPLLAPEIRFDGIAADSSSLDQVEEMEYQPLQYHHQILEDNEREKRGSVEENGRDSNERDQHMRAEGHARGRSLTPQDMSETSSRSPIGRRPLSASPLRGGSGDGRPTSSADMLNIPHSQQMAQQSLAFDNAFLRNQVGANASLLDTRKTIDMYRANLKKTTEPGIQYEFAIFMVYSAQQAAAQSPEGPQAKDKKRDAQVEAAELLREARQILQKLADRSYIYAQYYLADGYASGLFSKGKDDYDRAFPLFVSAGKHGHAEAGYRAALCYEFGWGCRRDYAKAVQFYRQSASKNHPGAATRLGRACLTGDMGLHNRHREGVKWLKRATESADSQHNSAPYELGLLHLTGFGDDVFKDESYAAQLFTQAAELGHPEANLRMGEAYERGLLTCPRDPALSIHFYTGAAQLGLARAMMALCAWYMVGAEPVLEKNEPEAYEWAKRAAETGMAKAEFAVGYFTEMGIGCRRDPLEANVYYVRAADHGEERAKHRLAIIRSAETGDPQFGMEDHNPGLKKKKSGMMGLWHKKE